MMTYCFIQLIPKNHDVFQPLDPTAEKELKDALNAFVKSGQKLHVTMKVGEANFQRILFRYIEKFFNALVSYLYFCFCLGRSFDYWRINRNNWRQIRRYVDVYKDHELHKRHQRGNLGF